MKENLIALHIGNIQGILYLMKRPVQRCPDHFAIETGIENIDKLCEKIMKELKTYKNYS